MATTVTQRIARSARRAIRPGMSTRVVTSISANSAEEEITAAADPTAYDRANSVSVPAELAPLTNNPISYSRIVGASVPAELAGLSSNPAVNTARTPAQLAGLPSNPAGAPAQTSAQSQLAPLASNPAANTARTSAQSQLAPVVSAASAAAPSSNPEEAIGLGEVDYEEPEEVLLSVGEARTLIAKRLREVDSSGFVVGPSAIRFLEGSQTEITSFSLNYQSRKMTIAETSFFADVFDDSDLFYDEIVKDYSTIYDGADISVIVANGAITYDSAESAELERKFWRINRQEAVYDNLLQADFNYSLLIEPPVVQTVEPEGIDISSFTSLIETSEAT